MSVTFSHAGLVYVWLGQCCNGSDRALDFASRVGPRTLAARVLGPWPYFALNEEICDQVRERFESSEGRGNGAQALELARFIYDLNEPRLQGNPSYRDGNANLASEIYVLLQRDYWRRIWIIKKFPLQNRPRCCAGLRACHLMLSMQPCPLSQNVSA